MEIKRLDEVIRDIAEKTRGTRIYYPDVWVFFDHELQEFAEYIINECADIALNKTSNAKYDDPVVEMQCLAGRAQAFKEILKAFNITDHNHNKCGYQ